MYTYKSNGDILCVAHTAHIFISILIATASFVCSHWMRRRKQNEVEKRIGHKPQSNEKEKKHRNEAYQIIAYYYVQSLNIIHIHVWDCSNHHLNVGNNEPK